MQLLEREIDDAVGTAEVHGRLGPLRRQRVQAFARASGEQDYEDVVERHGRSSIIAPHGPLVPQKLNSARI
jgi:hypothetical protein